MHSLTTSLIRSFGRSRRKKSKCIEKNKQKDNEKNESTDNETSFAQKMICYCCGQPGHLATECPKREKIPREE